MTRTTQLNPLGTSSTSFQSMGDIQKLVRSKSQKLLGALETVLNLPVTLDKQLETGDNLAKVLTRRFSKKEEEEFEGGFTGMKG